jgi:hypothetical protein
MGKAHSSVVGGEIPNPKSQITNKTQIPNGKTPIQSIRRIVSVGRVALVFVGDSAFGALRFCRFEICLGFVICDLELAPSAGPTSAP